MQKLTEMLQRSVADGTFIRAVCSGKFDKTVKKCVFTPAERKSGPVILQERFMPDGKALHSFCGCDNFAQVLSDISVSYKQTDIFCGDFTASVLRSKKGAVHISYGKGAKAPAENKPDKNYILSPDKKYDFLVMLGIQDKNGRVYDKKQSKFRQINRFLEIVKDTLSSLPEDDLTVWDLCCGKSYLSFAVYYYFRYILDRQITIYCVDRKEDVIKECAGYAEQLGWDGMKFICGDIFKVLPDKTAELVLSLHACDTATDMVLSEAVRRGAKVILSSPCCQHELASQIKNEELSYILREPILKQKLSVVITDALRCRLLYTGGYKVTTLEFIDPEDTPKNLMIRAEKTYIPKQLRANALKEYDGICESLNVRPSMRRLLDGFLSDLREGDM